MLLNLKGELKMATKAEKQSALDYYVKAQTEMGKALKNATNPHFRSQYADLGNVLEACLKPFNDNGFILTQPSGRDEGGEYVDTILTHVTGESFTKALDFPDGNISLLIIVSESYSKSYLSKNGCRL